MKFHLPLFVFLASLFLGAFATGTTQAYTSTDYYNAGLQLYKAQNYQQAIQYFSAAIQIDPTDSSALQGRANSYYSLGQYQQALDDYQKVQTLQPNPQLASMIQALQAKLGTNAATAAPLPGQATSPEAPLAPPSPATDSFAQGVALYQQRQYAQAAPLFQKAAQDNPTDSKAYYYLGVCQMQQGDMKDAAVDLGISNKLNPNPSVAGYVDRLKSRLAPDDQQWVDSQISAAGSGNPQAAKSPTTASSSKTFGIRLEPSILLFSLGDFNTNAQSWSGGAVAAQPSDPSLSYNGIVPTASLDLAFEPVLNLGPDLQVGLPVNLMPVGTASDNLQDNNGVTFMDSYNITGLSIGLDLRYFFMKGDWRPYVCAGGLVAPINIEYSASANQGTTQLYSASGNFAGVAAGGQFSAGLDWHLGDTFVVSPFAGFQFAGGNSFQATINSGSPGAGQTTQLYVIPTSVGNVIAPVSNGKLVLPVLNGSQPSLAADSDIPSGSRPLEIDLSGPYAGIQVSAFF